jgi:hypothetical protein
MAGERAEELFRLRKGIREAAISADILARGRSSTQFRRHLLRSSTFLGRRPKTPVRILADQIRSSEWQIIRSYYWMPTNSMMAEFVPKQNLPLTSG